MVTGLAALPALGGAAAVVAVGAVLAVGYAALRGSRTTSLEALARWAQARGLTYVPPGPGDLAELARFDGTRRGVDVSLRVQRADRRTLADIPPQVTVVSVTAPGVGTWWVQPREWVMDMDGRDLPEPVDVSDAAFAARWAAFGSGARAALGHGPRQRLMRPDAQGLVVEATGHVVRVRTPGTVTSARDLDRVLDVTVDIASAVGALGG